MQLGERWEVGPLSRGGNELEGKGVSGFGVKLEKTGDGWVGIHERWARTGGPATRSPRSGRERLR